MINEFAETGIYILLILMVVVSIVMLILEKFAVYLYEKTMERTNDKQ